MARHHTLWADQRLAEAYDLVHEVVSDHALPGDELAEIAGILSEIDRADRLLAEVLGERAALAKAGVA